ncbi:helix-turn-helix domain-containing protein [Streptomyces mirabilis]
MSRLGGGTVSIFARSGNNTDLAAAHLARQATASLAGVLSGLGKSRSDLAKAMGVSPGRVSQIMSGDANLTVRTLAAVAEALGASVEIKFYAHPETANGQNDGSGTASPTQGSSLPSGFLT